MTLTLLNNRYQVLLLLGNGGFGKTFLAEDTQMPSNKRCVIKQLIPVANNPKIYQLIQARFQQEAAILEELGDRHDLIPQLYAYFSEGNLFYLVQEYIEGQTLTARVQQLGVMNELEVREMLFHTLMILEFVHSKGIVHRDIKPDNIILRSSDGKPVLIDFGAVKVTMNTGVNLSTHSTRSIVMGTPGFMPMEQSVGRPVFSSDLYSLGLTAIYLLTGKIPQDLPTEPSTGNILWRDFAPHVSLPLAAVLDKSIQQAPRDRYLTAREMWTALQAPPIPKPNPNPQSTPTIIASLPQVQVQPTKLSQNNIGLGSWQQAVITGGVIGAVLVIGLWILKPNESHIANNSSPTTNETNASTQPNVQLIKTTQPTTNVQTRTNAQSTNESITPSTNQKTEGSTQTNTNSSGLTQTNTSSSGSTQTNTNSSGLTQTYTSSSISRDAAVQVLKGWLGAKKQIFAPPYDENLGSQFLTGLIYKKYIKKTDYPEACIAQGNKEDDCFSSIDWLRKNQAYWVYGVQEIQKVKHFDADRDRATIVVVVKEERTLYTKDGHVDRGQSGLFTSTTSYNLQNENGQIKIYNYK